MHIIDIKDKRKEMINVFNDLIEEIEEFENKPTQAKKKELNSKFKEFNYIKNRLAHSISDFWC